MEHGKDYNCLVCGCKTCGKTEVPMKKMTIEERDKLAEGFIAEQEDFSFKGPEVRMDELEERVNKIEAEMIRIALSQMASNIDTSKKPVMAGDFGFPTEKPEVSIVKIDGELVRLPGDCSQVAKLNQEGI